MKDSYQTPLVSICSITYNHDKYIKDAMDGFLKQETNFPFEIVISDDCSTDNTRSLLKGYLERFPDKIRLLLPEENLGVVKNFSTTIAACRGKYIALCEGDDYWTDPLKLQKQVDFMEAHPECSLCCHRVLFKKVGDESFSEIFPKVDNDRVFTRQDFSPEFYPKTLSVLFRNNNITEYVKLSKKFKTGDTPLWFFLSQYGDIGYLNQIMGVYRIHPSGIYSLTSDLQKAIISYDTHHKLCKKFNLDPVEVNLMWKSLHLLELLDRENNYEDMRKYLFSTLCFLSSFTQHQKQRLKDYAIKAFVPDWVKRSLS